MAVPRILDAWDIAADTTLVLFLCTPLAVMLWSYVRRNRRRAQLRRGGRSEVEIHRLERIEQLQAGFKQWKKNWSPKQRKMLNEMVELGELDVERIAEGRIRLPQKAAECETRKEVEKKKVPEMDSPVGTIHALEGYQQTLIDMEVETKRKLAEVRKENPMTKEDERAYDERLLEEVKMLKTNKEVDLEPIPA